MADFLMPETQQPFKLIDLISLSLLWTGQLDRTVKFNERFSNIWGKYLLVKKTTFTLVNNNYVLHQKVCLVHYLQQRIY